LPPSKQLFKKQKIKQAKKFFENTVEIKFKTQFSNKNITGLMQEILLPISQKS